MMFFGRQRVERRAEERRMMEGDFSPSTAHTIQRDAVRERNRARHWHVVFWESGGDQHARRKGESTGREQGEKVQAWVQYQNECHDNGYSNPYWLHSCLNKSLQVEVTEEPNKYLFSKFEPMVWRLSFKTFEIPSHHLQFESFFHSNDTFGSVLVSATCLVETSNTICKLFLFVHQLVVKLVSLSLYLFWFQAGGLQWVNRFAENTSKKNVGQKTIIMCWKYRRPAPKSQDTVRAAFRAV